MEHDDFSGDISSDIEDDFSDEHEHELKIKYLRKSQWHSKFEWHRQVLAYTILFFKKSLRKFLKLFYKKVLTK